MQKLYSFQDEEEEDEDGADDRDFGPEFMPVAIFLAGLGMQVTSSLVILTMFSKWQTHLGNYRKILFLFFENYYLDYTPTAFSIFQNSRTYVSRITLTNLRCVALQLPHFEIE